MTYTEFKDAIWDWVNDNVNIPVIWSDSNGPRPITNYLTLRIGPFTEIGKRNVEPPDNTGDQQISYDIETTLSIQSFGRDSEDNIQELQDSLKKDITISNLSLAGIAFMNEPTITDLSESIDQTIEKRYLFEIIVHFARAIKENVGYVSTIEYTKTINQPV